MSHYALTETKTFLRLIKKKKSNSKSLRTSLSRSVYRYKLTESFVEIKFEDEGDGWSGVGTVESCTELIRFTNIYSYIDVLLHCNDLLPPIQKIRAIGNTSSVSNMLF